MRDNRVIRRTYRRYLKHYGPTDSRKVIACLAYHFRQPRQVISGNLSALCCKYETVKVDVIVPSRYSIADCAY